MRFLKQVEAIKCNQCLREINDWEFRTFQDDDYHECLECSFIAGKVDESIYLKLSGENTNNAHVAVNDGKVVVWYGRSKTPPWERKRRKR